MSIFYVLAKIGQVLAALMAACGLYFFILMVAFWVYEYARGRRREGGKIYPSSRPGIKALLLDAPLMIVEDWYNRPRDFFRPQGMIVFTGRQGAGKTVAMTEQVLRWRKEYPGAWIMSNYNLQCSNQEIADYYPLITYKNGHKGVIAALDELQNWFASSRNKDFPPEMLEVITQNRKNRRCILGTSQVFQRLAKPLREQVTEVRKCFTFFGCLTFVFCQEPVLDASGDVVEFRNRGMYWFVHTHDIREAYDTWAIVERLVT